MAHPNEDRVREGFAAFGRGDMDALRNQSWTEDIVWHVPGRNPIAGDFEGPEQILQGLARVFELAGGTYGFELHEVIANDERAVAMFTSRAERAGRTLNDNMIQVMRPRDGKVAGAWLYSSDQYAQDESWSWRSAGWRGPVTPAGAGSRTAGRPARRARSAPGAG